MVAESTIHELLDRLEMKIGAALAAKAELTDISEPLGMGFSGAYMRNQHAWPERRFFGGTGPDNCTSSFTYVYGAGWVRDDHYQNEMRRG